MKIKIRNWFLKGIVGVLIFLGGAIGAIVIVSGFVVVVKDYLAPLISRWFNTDEMLISFAMIIAIPLIVFGFLYGLFFFKSEEDKPARSNSKYYHQCWDEKDLGK